MKEKILLFVVGVLVGAVVSTGAFYVYNNSKVGKCNNQTMRMPGGAPPSMPGGNQQGGNNNQSGNNNQQPPEIPNGNQNSNQANNNSQSTDS